MDQPLTAIKKLDLVLQFLASRPEAKPAITLDDLYSELIKLRPELDKQPDFASDLQRILNKLTKEEYIYFDEEPYLKDESPFGIPRSPKKLYKVAFDGKLLVETRRTYETVINEKAEQEKLVKAQIQSTIDSNLSSKFINDVVIPRFNRTQRNFTLLTISIALLSFIAIAFSGYYAKQAVTGAQLLKLDTTLRYNNRLLDSMQKFQKEIDSSLRKAAIYSSYRK